MTITEIFAQEFMQRAVIAGVASALLASIIGVQVVLRGLSFASVGLSHSAFGGVALGFLLNLPPVAVAVPFVVATALLMVFLGRRGTIKPDTAIGVLFAATMGLGVIFLSLANNIRGDAMHYLFGSILIVTWADVFFALGVLLLVLCSASMWGRWCLAGFDRELAGADNANRLKDEVWLMVLIALATTATIKLVGMVMLASIMVIPAATARQLSPTVRAMAFASVGIGIVSVVFGLLLSASLDLPSGAVIVMLQTAFFGLTLGLKALVKNT